MLLKIFDELKHDYDTKWCRDAEEEEMVYREKRKKIRKGDNQV